MSKRIDNKLENGKYNYYCEPSSLWNIENRLFSKSSFNCSDTPLQYDNMDESIKKGFVVACMKVVLEDWDNRESLINIQNKLYGFDLIKEFHKLVKEE